MSNFLIPKYIGMVSFRLRNFKRKGPNLWNFSCPFCGDSKKNKHKARGYIFERKGEHFYKCHNCPESMTVVTFLKRVDLPLYKQYTLEKLKEEGKSIPEYKEQRLIQKHLNDVKVFNGLPKAVDNTLAKKFMIDRKIPTDAQDQFYFTDDYQKFVNSHIPKKLKNMHGPRLIIPFRSFNGDVIGWQGRALDNNTIRYSYIVLDESIPRAFGINNFNPNKKYYVVEGPFDSLFLDNAIAIGGSDLYGGVIRLGCPRENAVIVFDNEPRNLEIMEKLDKAIDMNFKVCIWPESMIYKDINDCIKAGYTSLDVMTMIDQNTKSGITAKLAFTKWKRV